jgi:hypothetical protein
MTAASTPEITIARFESGDIDADNFDHEAHIYLAWLYLEQLPVFDAVQRYSLGLRRLTRQLGIPGKYHETITCFYLFKIAERREAGASDWLEFRQSNKDLFARGDASVLHRFYRRETLESERARRAFVLPDRAAA